MSSRLAAAFGLLLCVGVTTLPVLASSELGSSVSIVGVGNVTRSVVSLERSLDFYRDSLGLPIVDGVRPVADLERVLRLTNSNASHAKRVVLRTSDSSLGVELVEFELRDRRPKQPRFQDPGAGNVIVTVRDLDGVMARLFKLGVHVVSLTGKPAEFNRQMRVILLRDPDGYLVELVEPQTAQMASSSTVSGFELSIADSRETVAFYRDIFGFKLSEESAFMTNPVMNDTAGTPGAHFRIARLDIPQSNAGIRLIEFQRIERRRVGGRVFDPGVSTLQLLVRDLDRLARRLTADHAVIATRGSQPVTMEADRRLLVRDPNGLYLELIEPKGN